MKQLLLILAFITFASFASDPLPTDYDHTIVNVDCECSLPFKDTVKWTQGKRGGYYCITIGNKSGVPYKRYFSSWLKLKNR
jgi:hypothetical protein